MRALARRVVAVGLCLGMAGCPSTDTDDTDPDTDPPPPACTSGWSDGLGPDPSFDVPWGRFRLIHGQTFGYVEGGVWDGTPIAFHQESAREGSCRLVRYAPSTCAPACEVDSVCVEGACAAHPTRVPVGSVFLHTSAGPTGLGDDGTGGYFGEVGPVNGLVVLAAAGTAELPAFELRTCAVPAVSPVGDWSASLAARQPGQDVALTWSDPLPDARVALRMTTGVATHGGIAHAEIECEGPDTGSLTLPGAFLDVLYSEGWSCGECGSNDLFRVRADQIDVGGHPVRLSVDASTPFFYIP